jgi:hypothetical protein
MRDARRENNYIQSYPPWKTSTFGTPIFHYVH